MENHQAEESQMGNHQVEESRVVNKNQKEILWEDSIKRYIADTFMCLQYVFLILHNIVLHVIILCYDVGVKSI